MVAELGAEWRHITYDQRARGKKSTLVSILHSP